MNITYAVLHLTYFIMHINFVMLHIVFIKLESKSAKEKIRTGHKPIIQSNGII
jgi:hypothetical protein